MMSCHASEEKKNTQKKNNICKQNYLNPTDLHFNDRGEK